MVTSKRNVTVDPKGLLAALSNTETLIAATNRGGMKCKVGLLLETMPESTATTVRKTINNPNIAGTTLATVINSYGYNIRAENINRHRKRGTGGGCRCPQ